MASPAAEVEDDLKDVGNKLLHDTSSIVHLLTLLDKAENLLSRVEQAPSRSVEDAMLPVMKALIRSELISHSEIDVKASVASCLHEIIRITAPMHLMMRKSWRSNTNLNSFHVFSISDSIQMGIFNLTVMLLKKLSLDAGHCYTKAVSILENMANVRSCLVMLDIEVDELIVEMFQLFFKIIRPYHPVSVFLAMETIMILVIEEIEEMPFQLLTPLLFSMKKENQDISPLSYKLGENVFKKCAAKLKPYLSEGLRLSASELKDYPDIVSSACQDAFGRDSILAPAKEPGADATGHEDDSPQVEKTQTSLEKSNVKTLDGSVTKTRDLMSKGHQSNSTNSTSHGEDKSASLSQNNSFSEGNRRRRGRPKKDNDPNNLGGDASKEFSGKKKVSFSASRSKNEDDGQMRKSCKAIGKRKHSQQKQRISEKFGEELIGRRIRVWWPMDETFYAGVIYSYNPVGKKHRVLYADGEEELLNLYTEIWEFVGESKFPDEGKDDVFETCDEGEDDKQNDDGKAKKTQCIDKSKRDKKSVYGETGYSDRDKNKKKRSKNTNRGSEAKKMKKVRLPN